MLVANQTRKSPVCLPEVMRDCAPEDLVIYGQAYLELTRPFMESSTRKPQTIHEVGVQFNIDGDVSGNVFCLVDLYKKKPAVSEYQYFQSLFVESMNILIGRLLTEASEKHQLKAQISSPKLLPEPQVQSISSIGVGPKILSGGYDFVTATMEYDCRIVLDATR